MRGLCCGLPRGKGGPAGRGQHQNRGARRLPRGPSRARGPCPLPTARKERALLFTVRASPSWPVPRALRPQKVAAWPSLGKQPPPAPSCRSADAGPQDAGGNPDRSRGGAAPPAPQGDPRVHCTSPRLHTQLQLSSEHKQKLAPNVRRTGDDLLVGRRGQRRRHLRPRCVFSNHRSTT